MLSSSLEYAWKDIEVVLLGRPVVRLLEITYSKETTKTPIYGRGKKTLGIQEGNEAITGTILIGQSELEAMQRAVQQVDPTKDITDIQCDISVSYIKTGSTIVRDRIVGARFTTVPKGMAQGAAASEHSLAFVALDIKYNV